MKYLDLTLPTPEQNLACDEALLDWREEEGGSDLLRLWTPVQYFVVLGYANRARFEVNLAACRSKNVPIFRRCSGGGAVLQGPGCLNYTLILKISEASGTIAETNCFVMQRQREAVQAALNLKPSEPASNVGRARSASPVLCSTLHDSGSTFPSAVQIRGFTDLTLGRFKFSGNAQRRKREFLLFHGSFLLNFNLALIEELLPMPSKRPEYRRDRPHLQFLTNLDVPARRIGQALQKAWTATEPCADWPENRTETLTVEKYSEQEWNLKF